MSEWEAGLESRDLPASSELSNCKAPNLAPEERKVAGGLARALEEQAHGLERKQGLLGEVLWVAQQLGLLFVST